MSSCTAPSMPMNGVTVSVVPICCWVTVELDARPVLTPAADWMVPVTTGRV